MALADTGEAIGAISELLQDQLGIKMGTSVDITVGRPELQTSGTGSILNLFLYEIQFDGSLKNFSLDERLPTPLWLVLKYLITAFDNGESDSLEAHKILGRGLRALQELSFLPLNSLVEGGLRENPEVLKLTFDETPPDLLSKLMQGPDEKYRSSVGFQVRPVMIATGDLPAYSLLVGIDYTVGPGETTEEPVQIPAIPAMGPAIRDISLSKFEIGSTLTISGNNLHLSGLAVRIGNVEMPVVAQQPDRVLCTVNESITRGNMISAGSHPVSIVQTLPTGRRRSSNLLVGNLLPVLESAVFTPSGDPDTFGFIDMTGILLGEEKDDIYTALYTEGKIIAFLDEFAEPDPPPAEPQTGIRLRIREPVPAGVYRVILKVNGQQAKNSPEVTI
jgi:hypothetical protein